MMTWWFHRRLQKLKDQPIDKVTKTKRVERLKFSQLGSGKILPINPSSAVEEKSNDELSLPTNVKSVGVALLHL